MFALVPTLIIAAWVSTVSYLKMVRGSRLRLFNGAVLESGFGESEMVFRNPREFFPDAAIDRILAARR